MYIAKELLDKLISIGYEYIPNQIPRLTDIRLWLITVYKINIIPKFYETGKYSFIIYNHNGDATGWTKISFIEKSFYNYDDAFEGGIYGAIHKITEEKIEPITPYTMESAVLYLRKKIDGSPIALQYTIFEAIHRIENNNQDIQKVLEWYNKIEQIYLDNN